MKEVLNQILAGVMPVVVTAIVGILVAIINSLGKVVEDFIKTKKETLAVQIGTEKYNQQLAFAKSIYAIVEEYFRLNEVVGDKVAQKQEMFDKLLKEKIPYLTDSDLIHLRQAIVGQFNLGKEVIVSPASIEQSVQEQTSQPVSQEVQETIAEMHDDEPKEEVQ
jgi:hypothetical protein